jgi:hypothetical protein
MQAGSFVDFPKSTGSDELLHEDNYPETNKHTTEYDNKPFDYFYTKQISSEEKKI